MNPLTRLKCWMCCLAVAGLFPSIQGGVDDGTGSDSGEPRDRLQVTAEMRTPHLKTEYPYPSSGYRWYGNYPGYWDYWHFGLPRYAWSYPPYMGEIGRSTVWVAAGSQGYLGGGFSTRQPVGDTPFVYGISISREQGEIWYSDFDYQMTTINPWLEWHGENFSFYGGFSNSSGSFSRRR